MKKIIARIDFKLNDKDYIASDELFGLTYNEIVKLNEKGYIEPLTYKDLVLIKRELDNSKKIKKEEEL